MVGLPPPCSLLCALAAALAAAGCTCVGDPKSVDFACDSTRPCASGWTCVGGHCHQLGGGTEDCENGIDDDGDNLADCADPKCLHAKCTSFADHVCCSTSAQGCTDMNDVNNCGGCGIVCPAGATCEQQVASGWFVGTCTCPSGTGPCPTASDGGLVVDQVCTDNLCQCNANGGCAPGQTCEMGAGAKVCRY